jgi:CMP/dCMP kinase
MTASVVTFSIQVGSDGFSVARNVAERLGFRYYDWHITSKAAEREDAEEDLPYSMVDRMMKRLMAATIDQGELPASMLSPSPALLAQALQTLGRLEHRMQIEEVVRQLANSGSSVIVGHGSQVVLENEPNVLKVLVVGDLERRAARLAAEQGSSVVYAKNIVQELDKLRDDFFRATYNLDWLSPSLYDLVINTDDFATEACTALVLAAAHCQGSRRNGREIRPALQLVQDTVAELLPSPLSLQRLFWRREQREVA